MTKNASLLCDLSRVKIGCRYFILAAALALLILPGGHIRADTLQIANTGTGFSGIEDGGNFAFQSFTPAADFSLSQIGICVIQGSYPNGLYLTLQTSAGVILATSNTIASSSIIVNYPCNNLNYFIFPTPYALVASNTYYFRFGSNSNPGTDGWGTTRYAEGNNYASGCAGGANLSTFPNCASGGDVSDGLFEIYSAPTNTIQIDFPPNTTSTPDFDYWGLSGNSLLADKLIHINWGNSTSSWSGFTNYFLDNSGAFSLNNVPKSFSIPVGIFYAQAWITECPLGYDLYGDCIPSTWNTPYGLGLLEPLATSTLISFTITGENPYIGGYYGTYYPTSTPTSTATSSEWVITCDPDDPLWSRSICQLSKWVLDGMLGLLKFLFIPKDSDFQQFTNLKTMLEHKAPMGYFYAIKDALVFNSTTTKAFDLASSTVAMVSPVFNPLKTGITFILWLLFAFWLFNRIKHFNL